MFIFMQVIQKKNRNFQAMSDFSNVMLIKPPVSYGELPEEHRRSSGHTCPYCKGNGWFWKDITAADPEKEACKVCGGVGKIDAEITIRWVKSTELDSNHS